MLKKAGIDQRLCDEDKASWLTPITCCQIDGSPLSLDDYLTLVDATGRIICGDKCGHIPPELAPIPSRLDIELKAWPRCMQGWRQFLCSARPSAAWLPGRQRPVGVACAGCRTAAGCSPIRWPAEGLGSRLVGLGF